MASTRQKADYTLLIVVIIIILFGLVMLASASSVLGFEKFKDSNYYVKHQLLYGVLVGIVALIITSKIDYHKWKKLAFILMAGTILLMLAVLIPGIGFGYGGANRWVTLGPLILQPTEVLKLVFILYLSTLFTKNIEGIRDTAYGLMPFLIILGSIIFLIMLQPDMGTMITIAITSIIVFFIAGAPIKHLAWILMGATGLILLLIKIAPYRAARLTVFLNPALDPQGIGYHINQALMAIGSGGILAAEVPLFA
jgi:cell division protein FtsW